MSRLVAVSWPDVWRPDWPNWPDWRGWLERLDVERVLPDRLAELSFGVPELLWGLALIPLALLAYAGAQRRRGRYAVRFTNVDLLAGLVERKPGPRRHLPPLLYLAALALLVLGLAKPEMPVTVPREEATVVLVMDVSGSMEAQDVPPTRLAAAKVAANTFLDQLPERFRIGIVTFSSAAQTILPLTTDHDLGRAAIDGLRADGGTAMGDAIVHALELVSGASAAPDALPVASSQSPSVSPQIDQLSQAPAVVVLLSDGESTSGRADPIEAASEAGRRDVPVFTIALGTPDGEIVSGNQGNQERVPVPPDEETLARVAELSGGRSFSAPTDEDLRAIYEGLGSQLGHIEQRREVTAAFAGGALALLVLGAGLALAWFDRFP